MYRTVVAYRFWVVTTAAMVSAGLSMGVSSPAAAVSPGLIHYQGYLHDDVADPIDGTADLSFAVFAVETGGVPLWIESHTGVMVTGGVFLVVLGSINPLSADLFAAEERWLEVALDGGDAFAPRRRFASVPYAHHVDIAESVIGDGDADWSISGLDVYRLDGSVGVGTSTPGADFHLVRDGDASIRIDSDPANVDESAQPSVTVTQDGGAVGANIGFFNGTNDFTIQRFSPGPDSTAVTFLDSGNNLDVNADVVVGGGVTGADVSDGVSEVIVLRGRSASWALGVQNESLAQETDFFIGRSTAEDGTFHIERDGNVGIGTTSPSARLDVAGQVRADHFVVDTSLGANVTPALGGIYRDSVIRGWAHVAADGTLIESYGFVSENVSGDDTGEYVLRLQTPIIQGNACVVATPRSNEVGVATANATPNIVTAISVYTHRVVIGQLNDYTVESGDLEFYLVVMARP